MNQLTEVTPLILAGEGYQLTIAPDAVDRKNYLLLVASNVQSVRDNDESGDAAYHVRALAAMRIEVEKSRKVVKEPVNRIGKMIDAAASDFLAEITAEENRIKKLIGDHATEVARLKAEKEEEERKAFDAARAAREAAESGGIAAVLASKQALAERMAASDEVASTKVAEGVRFAWDFEVMDINLLASRCIDLVTIEPRRAAILAKLKDIEAHGYTVEKLASEMGIRAFKKPVVSSR
jgi:hypothetical protein